MKYKTIIEECNEYQDKNQLDTLLSKLLKVVTEPLRVSEFPPADCAKSP